MIRNLFEIDLLLFQIGSLEQKQCKKERTSLRCLSFLSLFSVCQGGYTYVTVSNLPARRQPHSVFGALCMPAPSVCFRTPRLSLGHPGSLTSVHDLKCMRTQTAPLFNVPRGRRGTTTRVIHPYPHGTSRAGNRTRVVVGGVQSAIH